MQIFKNKTLTLLLSYIVWILLLAAIFTPQIIKSIKGSGIQELLAESKEVKMEEQQKVQVVLYNSEGEKEFYIYTPNYGGTIYHDTIEALIDFDLTLDGNYDSILHEKTKLIGLTVKEGIAYVDFNKYFLKSKNIGPYSAMDQVVSTLMLFTAIEKVVILVEGKPLDSI